MAKSKRNKYAAQQTQAQLSADVAYGPRESALRSLLRDAKTQLETSVKGETGAGRGIAAAIDAARPEMKKVYTDAAGTMEAGDAALNSDIAKLGPSAATYVAISKNERDLAKKNLASAMARSLGSLDQQKVGAKAGALYAINQAVSRYGETSDKLGQQKLDLAGEKGKYLASTLGTLLDKRSERSIKRASQRETHRHNVEQEGAGATTRAETRRHNRAMENKGGTSGLPKGVKPLPPDSTRSATASIEAATGWAKHLTSAPKAKDRWRPSQIIDGLVRGISIPGTTDPNTLKAGPVTSLPKIDALYARAGVSIKENGYISAGIANALRNAGYVIPSKWLPPKERNTSLGTVKRAAGGSGKLLAQLRHSLGA